VSGGAFDCVHDFGERVNLQSLTVDQWSKDHVNMIRHDDSNLKIELDAVVAQTALENNRSRTLR